MGVLEGGKWVLNENTTFPLTIYNTTEEVVQKLRKLLDQTITLGHAAAVKKIKPLITKNKIQCIEVDKYIEEHKPRYLKEIDRLKNGPLKFTDLEELKYEATASLRIQPDCNLVALFEGNPKKYAEELTALLCLTYTHGHFAKVRKEQLTDTDVLPIIKNWQISATSDGRTCPFCREMSANKFAPSDYPKTPLHIGCRCCVVPETQPPAPQE